MMPSSFMIIKQFSDVQLPVRHFTDETEPTLKLLPWIINRR